MGSIVVHTCCTLYLPEYKIALRTSTLHTVFHVQKIPVLYMLKSVRGYKASLYIQVVELGKKLSSYIQVNTLL
jgi:hypothetical protein